MSNDVRETNRKLGSIIRQLNCVVENLETPADDPILSVLQDILQELQEQPQVEGLDLTTYCLDNNITGYVAAVYDEESGDVSFLYFDAAFNPTTVTPEGEPCSTKPDYEYKKRGPLCRQDQDTGERYEVEYCDIFVDGELITTVEFWYLPDGTVSNTTPAGTLISCSDTCEPATESFTGDGATLTEFHQYTLFIPRCCTVTITTSAGTIVLPPQDVSWVFDQKFDCLVSGYSISADCVDEITTILTKTI